MFGPVIEPIVAFEEILSMLSGDWPGSEKPLKRFPGGSRTLDAALKRGANERDPKPAQQLFKSYKRGANEKNAA
jgi:hypothetical protein